MIRIETFQNTSPVFPEERSNLALLEVWEKAPSGAMVLAVCMTFFADTDSEARWAAERWIKEQQDIEARKIHNATLRAEARRRNSNQSEPPEETS